MTNRKQNGREPVVRDAKWAAELERQLCAKEFGERTQVFARSRSRQLGLPADEFSISELVQNVIDDTFTGKLTWDPKYVDLAKHVMDTIQSRTRHRYKRRGRFQPLDGTARDALQGEAARYEQAHREELDAASHADALLAAYRELATGDPDLLRLISCYELRICKKADALHATDLSSRQYNAARERLRRLRDRLPHHLTSNGRG